MAETSVAQARINEAAIRLFAEKGTTQVSVSELAQAAGVARGTVYNNFPAPEGLFEEVAIQLAADMHDRIAGSADEPRDPAACLANGLRLFIRQAHEEPQWGRFVLRFAFANGAMRRMWQGQPAQDLTSGIETGRYRIAPEQTPSILAMVAASGLSAMFLVLEGYKTWREAGSDAAELILRALGVTPEEAREIANAPLPPFLKQ